MIVDLSKSNKSKKHKSQNLMHIPNSKAMEKPIFLILNGKNTFNYLWQTFIQALILQYFNLKYYI